MSDNSTKKSIPGSPSAGTPQSFNAGPKTSGTPPLDGKPFTSTNGASEAVASPFKKQRASLPGLDGAMMSSLNETTSSNNVGPQSQAGSAAQAPAVDDDEEL
jgi:hypothetical protein